MPRTSIIIATHNRAAMLRTAIESAKQAGSDVEVIVVDDASTDGTAAMCRELTGIVFIPLDRNVGVGRARNVGIAKSTGEFVAFLDDDDRRLEGSIDKQADQLARDESLGFVYGQAHVGDPERCLPTGEIRPPRCPSGDIFWELLKGNFIYVPCVLVRRRCLDEVGLFDPGVQTTEDWDLWIRLAERYAAGVIEEPVAIFRNFRPSSGQLSSNRPQMCRASSNTLIKALNSRRAQEATPETRKQLRSDYMNMLFDMLITEGRNALSRRSLRYALRNYLTAIRINPARARRPWVIKRIAFELLTAPLKLL